MHSYPSDALPQPGLSTLKPSAKPVGSPLNCLLGVFDYRGTEAQCLALSESLKPFYEDWLIFIVNLTRFRVTRRPHSGCVCEGVSRGSYWEGGAYSECDWHCPVGWILRWNLEKKKDRWALAATSLSFQTVKVMLIRLPSVPALWSSITLCLTLKPRARTNSYSLKLPVYQCFFSQQQE